MIEKVVLVKPPEQTSPFNYGTFSLATLAAVVRHRVQVSIIDATETSMDQAVREVWSRQPDLVGITSMGLDSVPFTADFIRHLKRSGMGLPIIVGGHGGATGTEELLRAGADAVVLGEGEITFQEIVEVGIQAGSAGVACLGHDGQVIEGPARAPIYPLDDLPMPARDLISPPPDGVHLLETSRGCPHACAFCETTRFYGRRWRPHSPERVVDEVRTLVNEYEALIILFADDNFAASPQRVRRICELLEEKDLPAFFMVSARGDDLVADPELLPAMARARMLRVCVGVETLDPDTAAAAGKPISLETYRQAFQRMRELGMFGIASLIVGLPGESVKARERAVERLVLAGPDAAQFLPFCAVPGVPMAAGRSSSKPDPVDVEDAVRFTQDFYRQPAVRARLQEAAAAGGSGVFRRGPRPPVRRGALAMIVRA
jgi:anaerobic magnesium-protoporphyrin IX monomethyl ester cyclase